MTGERGADRSTIARRTFVGSVGATTVVGLAGCFASDSGDESPSGETSADDLSNGDSAGNDSSNDDSAGGENSVVVGPGGKYTFEPESISVSSGTTVEWIWESANHNIIVESQPNDANWRGTNGGASETYDEGHEYEYAFETPGTYEYYCSPHEGLGMRGTVVVEE